MQFVDYKSFWDAKAATTQGAFIAVDGSADEVALRATGSYTARQVRAALDLVPGDRVLELGCGVARIGVELAPHVGHWHGVDISANMIEVARTRLAGHPNTSLGVLERTALQGIPDASLDKAYCVAVFIHMDKEDFFLYLREMRRVLRPGGRLYFDHWNLAHPVGWRRFQVEADSHAAADPRTRKDVARNQFCTPQEVEIYLRQAGLECLALHGDSPWVQAVATVPEAGADLAALRAGLQDRAAQYLYSQDWTRFFDRGMDLIYAHAHPRDVLADIQAAAPSAEREMFLEMVRGFWQVHQGQFGPMPG